MPCSKGSERLPTILVTGAAGTIGRVLAAGWAAERLTGFDRPEADASDLAALTDAARGHDAIVHLAWDARAENFRNDRLAPLNMVMAHNALEAALRAGVSRVLLASSVHADAFWPPSEGRLEPERTPTPDSPYGASKAFVEALGRHYAAHRGLEVAAVRFGGVNPADELPDEDSERAVWLPHRDCVEMFRTVLKAPFGDDRFRLVVAVGDGPRRVHSYGRAPLWPAGASGA